MYCWFIRRLRCRTKLRGAPKDGPQSLPSPSMKSRAFRPSPTLRPICPRFPENIPMWAAITNTNGLGTCSILAALDQHEGHVTARVERRHRSREFIALLKDLD